MKRTHIVKWMAPGGRAVTVSLLFAVGAGCQGQLSPGDGNPGVEEPGGEPGSSAPDPDNPANPAPDDPAPGRLDDLDCASDPSAAQASSIPVRAWRLTERQYRNTVEALFASARGPDAGGELPASLSSLEWPFSEDGNLSGTRFSTLSDTPRIVAANFEAVSASAELVARAYVEELMNIESHCLGQAPVAFSCLESLTLEAAQTLYRRPVERSDLVELLDAGQSEANETNMAEVAESLVFGLLVSPRFLFRIELGLGAEPRTLDPYEIAELLSYSVTDAPPDATLRASAESGGLSNPEVVNEETSRLMRTPLGQAKLTQFFREYFRYDKLHTVEPRQAENDAPQVDNAAMVEDTNALVSYLVADGHADQVLQKIFTSNAVFAQERTAPFYQGADGLADAPAPVEQQEPRRYGILTQPSWLIGFSIAHRNDPIERGKFIRTRFLCGEVPEVDIGDVEPLSEDSSVPLRSRMNEHMGGSCAGCHSLFNPLGFALEQYDHLGRYRETEGGVPVDTSGEIVDGGDASGPFQNTAEFMAKLASSRTVSTCFSKHAYEFFLGQELTRDQACLVREGEEAFVAAAENMSALLGYYFANSTKRYNP